MARIGVLALQGGYQAHARVLRSLGHAVVEVRTPNELEALDGLVLPGGESTTQLKLMVRCNLEAPIKAFAAAGKPVLATCAGLILAARKVINPEQPSLALLDVVVRRNAYGRQLESFESRSDGGLPLVFIRAPRVVEVGNSVEVLDQLDHEPILLRQGSVVATTFHPELADVCDVAARKVHAEHFGTVSQDSR